MTRRQALGLLLLTLLIAGGRVVRQQLLMTSDGNWRDPLWLDSLLQPPPDQQTDRADELVLTEPVDINHCSAETLLALPGIGPVLAERLLVSRANGVHFAVPEDLQKIKGIGPKLASRLSGTLIWPADSTVTSLPAGDSLSEDPRP